MNYLGKLSYRPIGRCLNQDKLIEHVSKRGEAIEETVVTAGQRKLLFGAVTHSEKMPDAITEIGALGEDHDRRTGGTQRQAGLFHRSVPPN